MSKRIGFAVSVIATVIVLGWMAPHVRGAEDIKGQIETANVGFSTAFAAGNATAVAACYTADAQILPAGTDVVSGTAAIEAFWKGMMGGPVKAFTPITTEAEQHGDTAIEVGHAELFDADGNIVDTLKFIVIWKRVDGKWKLHRDIFNSSTPPN